MMLKNCFDAVLMLTWSDWETEPRSNRYHYATRFARELPVIFIQNQRPVGEGINIAASDIDRLDIVNVQAPIHQNQVRAIKELLRCRGIKRPLIWIYDSVHYGALLDVLPYAFRVYHATEDYFTQSSAMPTNKEIGKSIADLTRSVHMVVAVTENVLAGIQKHCEYSGPAIVAENGCDYEFFANLANEIETSQKDDGRTVIYQGALNNRLDYELLCSVSQLLPEYKFKFFGKITESDGLNRLRKLGNVDVFGYVSPEFFGKEMCSSSVGIIPFIQDQWIKNSLPLKTFEYIACGLPVVSVFIDALAQYQEDGVISFADSAEEFAEAIRRANSLRHDSIYIEKRRALAELNSYNNRFHDVCKKIEDVRAHLSHSLPPLNVAILFDPMSCHVGTVREHLEAFSRYSCHDITYLPATNLWGMKSNSKDMGPIDLSVFDVAIIHYSVRISLPHHLMDEFADALEKFHGLKVLFIQDEYENVECARAWMERLKLDLVYTCVPLIQRKDVYPEYRFPYTEFLSTLTGYVPEKADIDQYIQPIADRETLIAYRGRELPAIYGQLGHEKYMIGVEAKRRAESLGLQVDIAVDESSRIYGTAWYQFLGSARATLGTESGSNVFDFDGSLARQIEHLKKANPSITFEGIWSSVLSSCDGKIRMNQISPKIFEAIRLRTALVLFEGDYSGVVKPHIHYIPLKKDFSNFEDVIDKLRNDEYLIQITTSAYADIIDSGEYSYRRFIEGVDQDLRDRCFRRQKRKLMYGPVFVMNDAGQLCQCLPAIPLGLSFAGNVLDGQEPLLSIRQKLLSAAYGTDFNRASYLGDGTLISSTRRLSRNLLIRCVRPPLRKAVAVVRRFGYAERVSRIFFSVFPDTVKGKIRRLINNS